MATIAQPIRQQTGDDRFFLISSIMMALILVAGFSNNIIFGRSTFASPPLLHAHAIVFFGWVVLYVTQNVLVARGSVALHRGLGWIGAGWVLAMVVLGFLVTVRMAQRGQVPFFFLPQHFPIFDPVSILVFAGLTYAAIAMRRRTGWHRRLHFCGMALLLGPGFGRLLPMPLLIPWSYHATFVLCLLLPLAGVIADVRRQGHAHPAWWWGIGTLFAMLIVTEALTYSPVGDALYRAVTAGTPGANVPPLDFPPPPAGPLITGG